MQERVGIQPNALAHVGGGLYLIIIVIGLFGQVFVRDRIVVSGNAVATAANLKAQESLWRLQITTELFLLICAIVLLQILFIILRPVNRDLAVLAVLFNLVAIGVEAVSALDLAAVLFPLGTAAYLQAFTPEQLYAMAMMSVRWHGHGFGVSLLFFGCFCIVIGFLIFRSGYLPKAIGVLMQIAGVCYMTNSFALFLAPRVANRLFPAILVPAFIAELSFCLWLLIKGVDAERWNEWQRAGNAVP